MKFNLIKPDLLIESNDDLPFCINCRQRVPFTVEMSTGDCCDYACYCRDCLVKAIAVIDAAQPVTVPA